MTIFKSIKEEINTSVPIILIIIFFIISLNSKIFSYTLINTGFNSCGDNHTSAGYRYLSTTGEPVYTISQSTGIVTKSGLLPGLNQLTQSATLYLPADTGNVSVTIPTISWYLPVDVDSEHR
jgi:hypothetical protein